MKNSHAEHIVHDKATTRTNKAWYWLLVIPYLAIMWLPSYNRIEPRAFGIPFFYWYQLLWVILSTAVITVVLYFAHMRKSSKQPNKQTH